MASKLPSAIGRAIYAVRKSTVELVIGITKELLRFRKFSLHGLTVVAGEWKLICLGSYLKRHHNLQIT